MGPFRVATLVFLLVNSVLSQENAGTIVSPSLRICYNNTWLVTRDNRLPTTITALIDLIRKTEEGNPTINARELSIQLLHRFRQDGITKTGREVEAGVGLPYSPKGFETYKHRLLLKDILPGNAITFNNKSLNVLEGCSLHYMISSAIETHERGDESTVCKGIARYTSRLHKRESEFAAEQVLSKLPRSTCPIESGVVYTKWGTVKAGQVLAGIAAGYNPNPVPTPNGKLDPIYGSTIAGELTEVALKEATTTKTIGNKGGWTNSTLVPKYYFLEKNEQIDLLLTDAEIRGSLDGLYLGSKIANWKSSNIKISQILDLYYGRGVLNDTARACNRADLVTDLLNADKLKEQVVIFNGIFGDKAPLGYSPEQKNYPILAENSVSSFNNYWKTNLNDLPCSAEDQIIERVSTDVLIFIDMSWDYNIIEPFLAYFLDNIDVNKYESSYTIFDGINTDVIVNKSRSVLDFYEQYNLTQHQKYASGFDYLKVIKYAEDIFKQKLDNATDLTTYGQSTIVLMLPHKTPSSSEVDYIKNRRINDYKNYFPDLKIIVAGPDSRSSYNDLVYNSNSDVFTILDDTNESVIKTAALDVINRFKKIPRNVVNPKCGSSFNSDVTSFELTQYVDPKGVNYHKVSPNYFYGGKTLKVKGQGFGTLTVCLSRTELNPRANSTAGVDCETINSNEFSRDISSYCDSSITDCSPIYVSVEGIKSQIKCTEKTCRFPDNIKYSISLENVGCASSSQKFVSSILLVYLLFAIMRF